MGWVFPVIWNEKTSTLPTWRGVREWEVDIESSWGGVFWANPGKCILSVYWEAMVGMKSVFDSWLTIPESNRKRKRCDRRGSEIEHRLARLCCRLRLMLERCWERTRLFWKHYRLPDSAWEVRKDTLTWDKKMYISEIYECILENNLLLYYWIKY